MNRKKLTYVLTGLGTLLIVAGFVVQFVVAPAMKKLPSDTDETRIYSGTIATILSPQTFQFETNLPMTITRKFKVTASRDSIAQVHETRTMASGGKTIQELVSTYVVDRKSMKNIAADDVPASWQTTEGYWPRQGIVFSWPIDTKKKSYDGWSDDYRSIVPLTYADKVKHARSGMTLYHYTSASTAKLIDPAQVKLLGLPTVVPKQILTRLISAADLGPMGDVVKQQLPKLLASWSQDLVPLDYYYEYDGEYWIEPTTGVVIDTTKHEVRKVGLGQQVIKGTALEALPEAQQALARVTVSDYTYSQSDASVKEAKADANDLEDQIKLISLIVPLILMVVGLACVAGGVVLLRRKKA